MLGVAGQSGIGEQAYQRLVKTTPKPSATKNSSGELVGLFFLSCSPAVDEGVAEPVALAVVDIARASGGVK